ncbi:hypothetical protein LTR37_009385 [Vermiconidia calcicola]|uniref:Uncharacterized protein n=1 Tax=Vermiconidia calcicola TaxID=1690605 RepID=A0ACC3N7S6_9PEZI|nr:hypothetical protein LTR37_009385 [Vermiconidia calcicola]
MALIRSLQGFAISSLFLTASARIAPFHEHHKHEAVALGKRQEDTSVSEPALEVSAGANVEGVLTYITPSPGATPVAVTEQSQIVTSYIPQFTLCDLPPVGFVSISPLPLSARPTTAPYHNYSVIIPTGTGECTTIYDPTITMVCATTLTALVDRYTVTNCNQDLTFSTEYGFVLVTPTPASESSVVLGLSGLNATSRSSGSASATSRSGSVSATSRRGPALLATASSEGVDDAASSEPSDDILSSILLDAAESTATMNAIFDSEPIEPTSASEPIDATSDSNPIGATRTRNPVDLRPTPGLLRRQVEGNMTAMITPGPTIETLTTYYLAPWQELTAGTAPSDVDLKVCRTFAQNDTTQCIREYQVWSTSLVTSTATYVTSINISTTIHGMAQVIVETFVANVTEMLTTFSMSTTMDLEYQTEYTTTEAGTRLMSTSTEPTVNQTRTVELASRTSAAQDTTQTTTMRITSTTYRRTTTVTLTSSTPKPTVAATEAAEEPEETSRPVDWASMLGIDT